MNKGLKILMETYWSSKGWKDGSISDENFKTAKKEGYMFDYPKSISHEELLHQIRCTVDSISHKEVADAFLYSLSTRKLEYRSALGSYWYAVSIPKHIESSSCACKCDFCNYYSWRENPSEYDLKHGLNVLNFERYKWGGVRHTSADYALFDLQQFRVLPKVKPTEEDKQILHEILSCVYELAPHNKAGKLQEQITRKRILKSNAAEIDVLLDILGICGVLSSDQAPCYAEQFVDIHQRFPLEFTNDRAYPVNRWTASDGIHRKRYEIVFGEIFET